MQHSGLHRYAVGVAVCTFLLVITGAVVTSYQAAKETPAAILLLHTIVAGAAGLLTLGLALWLARLNDRPWLPKLGWTALVLVVLEGVVGMSLHSAAYMHAVLAQFLFGTTVAISVLTSASWCGKPELVADQMRPPMNTLARLTLGLVIVQVMLGAAVRHKMLNAMSHIGFAVVVALSALLLGMCLIHQAPQHRILRPAAITLMVVTGVQVFLGFTAFIVRLMAAEGAPVLVVSTCMHVSVGALTLGATVLAMLEVRRYVVRPTEIPAQAQPTTAG
jgi:heme A synthase